MKRAFLALVLGPAVVALGCASSRAAPASVVSQSARATAAAHPKPRARQAERRAPDVTLRRSAYGRVLFDQHGRALYLFTHDSRAHSRCAGDCAAAWPPFVIGHRPLAGRGISRRL